MDRCLLRSLPKFRSVANLMCGILFYPIKFMYRLKNKKRMLLRTFALLFFSVVFYIQFSFYFQPAYVVNPCSIPKLEKYAKSLDGVFWHIPTVHCDHWEDFVFFDNKGVLRMNDDVIVRNGYTNLTCVYSVIDLYDQNNAYIADTTLFNIPSYTYSDFVHVECLNVNRTVVYSNLLYKVDNKTTAREHELLNESEDQLSIIILGLDSVSRLVAERKLPLTIPYMRDKLGAYIMKGYTKVGDNTIPNLLAMLTGKTLLEAAIPTLDYPIIYKDIISKGYIDCYAEDWTAYFPFLGFKFPYYTHYLRKLFLAKEKIKIFMKDPSGLKDKLTSKSPLCFGNKPQHGILIDYCQKCVDSYENKLKYIFMWQNEIGHHQSNKVQFADEDLKGFLQRLNNTGKLQKTFVILVGDHGPRYGPVANNEIGRITGRLPLLAILLPDQLKRRFPHLHDSMLSNTNRLTTPFDLHETVKDIIYQQFELKKTFTKSDVLPRGISLFQNIPKKRSCFDAGVSEHYCPCYSFTQVSVQDKAVLEVSKFVVDTMNHLLFKEQDKCAKLHLLKIISAKIQHAPKSGLNDGSSINYVVMLETLPGHALFEATTKHYSSLQINMLGDINRLNKYSNQSRCIEDQFLHLYCYCHDS